MTDDTKHPIICTYKNTISEKFPLILVVGRESNSDEEYGHHIGFYDFSQFFAGGFWNSAYSVITTNSNVKNMQFKELCKTANSSPIIFANLSASPILNEVQNKRLIRKNIAPSDLEKHIKDIFSKKIMSRVRLIFISGAQSNEFEESLKLFIKNAQSRRLSFVEVPFFFGRNFKKIQTSLSKGNIELINSIIVDWKEYSTRK